MTRRKSRAPAPSLIGDIGRIRSVWKILNNGLVALAASLLLLAGCSRSDNTGTGGAQGPAEGTASNALVNPVRTVDEAQLAAVTNQFAAAYKVQEEAIQALLTRIEQMEKTEADRSATSLARQTAYDEELKQHQSRAEQFLKRIHELEGQVTALQEGRVLPEIVLAPEEGPTPGELDQKIRILERRNELAEEEAESKARALPRLTVGSEGFGFTSADANFALRLRGQLQLDTRTFIDDNPLSEGNDTFALRRARPIVEGTVFRDFDFQFVPDFGGSAVQIFDAWLNYRYRPELQLKAGKFKGPVGLEHLQSDANLAFNERGLVSNFMPIRNIGVSLWGDLGGGLLSYSAGVFNVAGDGRNPGNVDFGDDKEFAGRLFLHPFTKWGPSALKGLGFGVGGSYSQVSSNVNGLPGTTGGSRPGYVTPGLQQFFAYFPVNGVVFADGPQWRISPQLSYLGGPFGLMGEYGFSHQSVLNGATFREAGLTHRAWQVAGQWVLTGEPASFTGIVPKRPFSPASGNWGAWQLVARYGRLDIDSDTFPNFSNPATSARRATSWSVGLNWWLNRNLRVLASYSHTSFDGGGQFNPVDVTTYIPPATVTAQDENVVLTRLQLSF